jgi:uroporphyrinogen III methyltransferase/synthase
MTPSILVTRPTAQAPELAALLAERGLEPISVPTVAIDARRCATALDQMIRGLDGADWLVLTSANGADALGARMALTDAVLPPELRVAAVGPATAEALQRAGIRVDHVPPDYLTVAIAGGLGEVRGRRVVLARADAATPELRDALLAAGARVEEVIAYRTIEGPAASRDALQAALHRPVRGITFTSSSTVRGLLRLASGLDRGRARCLPAFCIGPVTAATAHRSGFHVAAVAAEHTAAGLAEITAAHFLREDR